MGQLVLPQGTAFTRVINLSETCPTPTALPDDAHHFLRIPIKDSYCAKLLPHFDAAFKFIDEARKTGGKVLVHCLAGISRSPTSAKQIVSDEAYKFVKVSPAPPVRHFCVLAAPPSQPVLEHDVL
uniref:protein-tyrosine-phosphatase n=1 Tax=Globodera rostochiensis TaxID=31243 RepID=A0A914HT97_GLORO